MNDEPALQLYGFWRSMAAYRVRVALQLKGIRAREIPINLDSGEQLSAQFLAVNPEGALPALIASDTHPLIVPRVRNHLMCHAGFDQGAWRAWASHWVVRGAAAMEQRLARDPATGSFCHGHHVTMADICLASLVTVARTIKFELSDVPTITRIVERCEQMDAFRQAHPMRQVGAPV